MARKTLKGEEAIKFLTTQAQGPGQKLLGVTSGGQRLAADTRIQNLFRQPQQQQQSSRPGGLLGAALGIGESIVNPFVTAGKLGLEGLGAASDLVAGRQMQRRFFDEGEQLGLKALQSAAGIGSFFVPGGSLLKGAIAGGALSGGLGAFSEGGDIEDIAQGALLGAGTGGVLNKFLGGGRAGKLAKGLTGEAAEVGARKTGRLGRLAEGLESANLGIGPTGKGVSAIGGGKQLTRDVSAILRGQGKVVQPKSIGPAFKQLSKQFGQQLDAATTRVPTGGILNDFTERLAEEGLEDVSTGTAGKIIDRQFNKLVKLGDNASPKDIANLKRQLDGRLSRTFDKMAKGGDLSDKELISLAMRESLDNSLKTQVPEISDTLRKMSQLHDAAPDITKKFTKAGSIAVPGTFGARVPTGGAPSRLRGAAAKVLRGVEGGGLPGLPGGVPGPRAALSKQLIPDQVPFVQRRTAGELAPFAVGAQQPGGQEQPQQQGFAPGSIQEQLAPFFQEAQQAQLQPQQQQQVDPAQDFAQAMQLTGGDVRESIALATFLQEQRAGAGAGQQLTAGQAESLGGFQSALGQLGALEETIQGNRGFFGPIQGGFLGDIAQSAGLSPERAAIQSQTGLLAQTIGRAFEGGKLTDADIDRYRKLLPNLSDTPDSAMRKLQQVRAELESQLGAQTQTLQQTGFAVPQQLLGAA
jgi:hypothetical protein